jgi:hypothetical protein
MRTELFSTAATFKEQVMFSRRQTVTKQWVMAAALAFGASGVALADGSSMDPFTGDSYAFFNGGCNKQQPCKPVFDNTASAFRQANPHGLSESQLQAIASEGPTREFTPAVIDKAASTWRREHPHGLSETELQAIASDAPTWQYRIEAENAAHARTAVATATKTGAR